MVETFTEDKLGSSPVFVYGPTTVTIVHNMRGLIPILPVVPPSKMGSDAKSSMVFPFSSGPTLPPWLADSNLVV